MDKNQALHIAAIFMAIACVFCISNPASSQEVGPNALTKKEMEEGWELLFDGKTTNGWRGANKASFPEKGWVVEDGTLTTQHNGGGGDIVTENMYSNFELSVDFKAPVNANSGIKYFVLEDVYEAGKALGLEYQTHDTGIRPLDDGSLHSIACLYELLQATNRVVNPAGEWNSARIVARGIYVEHWLNGIKVLEYERGGKQFREAVAKSKFKNYPNFGKALKGHILLQDHADLTAFRNIKIRELSCN
ncbi:3-keto-disaccharide hydrolase [Parapedobacter tibetensis]|uniref:3-keto-disaccharide hydrolase n=1 Tax=Parapedobacter tibetensis TaxID=2972951 RepID=UPI00214D52F5|nr:DUF1080 domain-containing protein [Parapedobacter tibetensis]